MIRAKNTLIAAIAALVILFASGCESGFVTTAARTSLASFVTDVFATAINETIGP